MKPMFCIRKASPQDQETIWDILHPIVTRGDVFAYDPSISKTDLIAYWCDPRKHTYVALYEDTVAGTFFIQDNQPGLGSHVANAAYAVSENHAARGLGRFMGESSLEEARRLGYTAMQFNLVVKSNERAVRLWQNIGFEIIGEIPGAFRHRKLGPTNAYIMHKKL